MCLCQVDVTVSSASCNQGRTNVAQTHTYTYTYNRKALSHMHARGREREREKVNQMNAITSTCEVNHLFLFWYPNWPTWNLARVQNTPVPPVASPITITMFVSLLNCLFSICEHTGIGCVHLMAICPSGTTTRPTIGQSDPGILSRSISLDRQWSNG